MCSHLVKVLAQVLALVLEVLAWGELLAEALAEALAGQVLALEEMMVASVVQFVWVVLKPASL
jgi:hypothetical protein